MVWPWFPSACSSFSLRVTRPDLTGVKLWTLLLNSTCWQVGAHKSGCAIEMPPILQLAEGGGSHQWLGEKPPHQLEQWNQTHCCQAFQQQPDQALLQAAHSSAEAAEQCWHSSRGCAWTSWCFTQEHKPRGRVKEGLPTRNGHLLKWKEWQSGAWKATTQLSRQQHQPS